MGRRQDGRLAPNRTEGARPVKRAPHFRYREAPNTNRRSTSLSAGTATMRSPCNECRQAVPRVPCLQTNVANRPAVPQQPQDAVRRSVGGSCAHVALLMANKEKSIYLADSDLAEGYRRGRASYHFLELARQVLKDEGEADFRAWIAAKPAARRAVLLSDPALARFAGPVGGLADPVHARRPGHPVARMARSSPTVVRPTSAWPKPLVNLAAQVRVRWHR